MCRGQLPRPGCGERGGARAYQTSIVNIGAIARPKINLVMLPSRAEPAGRGRAPFQPFRCQRLCENRLGPNWFLHLRRNRRDSPRNFRMSQLAARGLKDEEEIWGEKVWGIGIRQRGGVYLTK